MKTLFLLVAVASSLFLSISNSGAARMTQFSQPAAQIKLMGGEEYAHLGFVVGYGFNTNQAQADAQAKMWAEIAKISAGGWTLVSLEIIDEGPIGQMEYFIEFDARFTAR